MSLLEDLAVASNRKPNLEQWLAGLSSAERDAFESALADDMISVSALAQIVRNNGGATTGETLRQWREKHVAT